MAFNSKKYYLHFLLNKNKVFFNKNLVKNILINDACDLLKSKKNSISFFSNYKYLQQLKKTKANVIITNDSLKKYISKKKIIIISKHPDFDFSKIFNFFNPDAYFSKISYKNLSLEDIKKKYKTLKFGNNLYLESNVKIGKNVNIGNNVTIKENCIIGNNVIIGSNVTIEHSVIKNNVHICDGVIIGKKGFGFKFIKNKCYRTPHTGKVIINKGCEIGSNSVIDRGSTIDTIIGEDTFIDNLVHVAHNVNIGKRCIFAAQVGIAGSTKIGNNVIIGGQAGISGHLNVGNNVKIGGKSGVIKNVKDNEVVMGYPAKPFRNFIKNNK